MNVGNLPATMRESIRFLKPFVMESPWRVLGVVGILVVAALVAGLLAGQIAAFAIS